MIFFLSSISAFAENESKWTVIETLEDGSTYSIDKESIDYFPNGLFRIWSKMVIVDSNPSEIAEIIALIEVNCTTEMNRRVQMYFKFKNGRLATVKTPNTEPPYEPAYDWEPLNLIRTSYLLPLCKQSNN